MKQKSETYRIEIAGKGFGEAGDDLIFQRAAEIAKLNGHDRPTEHDILAAREELTHPITEPNDDDVSMEESERLGTGDPVVSHGTKAPRLEPRDEQLAADELVREGIEEADREIRIRSTEELD